MPKALKSRAKRVVDIPSQRNWIFGSMLAGSILSLIASLVLSIDAIKLAQDPDTVLGCSINVIVNCATVNTHPSAFLLGFPNSFIGLIAEPVVITVAIAGLSGVVFPRLFMLVAQFFYTMGFVFAVYLLGISYFVIGALCPWCLLVTLTTTLVWFSMTRYNILENNLYLSKVWHDRLSGWVKNGYDSLLMWSLVAIVIAAIIVKYGEGLFA